MEDYELFDRNTRTFIYGAQLRAVQRMLDFDYVCKREKPSVAGIITPQRGGWEKFFWGTQEIIINRYLSIDDAIKQQPDVDVMINFASERSAYETTLKALNTDNIRTVVMIAEGVPEKRTRELRAIALEKNKWIIGPSTVGGIKAGAFKIGNSGGTIENIKASKLYRPGSIGFVSVSGGLSNEGFNILARNTDGIYEGYAIGGDAYPGSTLLEHMLRYEKNPNIKMIVSLGELGGTSELEIAEAVKQKKITKPLVMWVTGTCARMLPKGVQFGHAGAKADSRKETAQYKNEALRKAGVIVPDSFDDYDVKIKETFDELVEKGIIVLKEEFEAPHVPMDYAQAKAEGLVRKPTNFVSTICDETGDIHNYCGVPIDTVIKEDYGIGGVLGLLWFKKKLPKYACDFLEMVIQIVADHGPAVSGAHNTIVTARAGKGLIESIISGMVTIGPRFGGAVNGAAEHFRWGLSQGFTAREFVTAMKGKNTNIQGIGHKIHTVEFPDARVDIMVDFAKKNFARTPILDFALSVQGVTTQKKNNLILNVDGCIGVLCVDLLNSLGYEDEEVGKMIKMGFFNALFIIGRTMGFMGHYFDQKRLNTRLYRHPWDDILYDVPDQPDVVQ